METASLLGRATQRLASVGSASPRLDAEVLLAHVLGLSRSALLARLGASLDDAPAAAFAALLERRARHEPIAYLTGVREFWSLDFAVTPAVLIPRPETELLVEVACQQAARRPPGEDSNLTILDLGTGSGCVAVAIAHELPRARVVAVDSSAAALALARRNAAAHGVAERISFCCSDLFAALDAGATFDLVVSNPPYLAPGDAVSPELAFEPRAALCGGEDGLAVIRRIVAGAPVALRPGGALVIEIGSGHAPAVIELARAAGLDAIRVEADLAGIPRALVAQRLCVPLALRRAQGERNA